MFRKKNNTLLEDEIIRVTLNLKSHVVGSDEYVKTMVLLQDLHSMQEEDKPKPVSKDVMATVAANLLGIFMVIKHEHVNVITSRAMQLLLNPIMKRS